MTEPTEWPCTYASRFKRLKAELIERTRPDLLMAVEIWAFLLMPTTGTSRRRTRAGSDECWRCARDPLVLADLTLLCKPCHSTLTLRRTGLIAV